MTDKTIAIACDHGGYDLKIQLIPMLKANGLKVFDLGTNSTESTDYPEFAYAVASAINDGKTSRGVLCCGSGIGISIAANRNPNVRAALIHDALGAKLCRQHNDANVICFGGRITGVDVAVDCLEIFLNTPFEGGRHERRVKKLSNFN
jgi:ribose 5-phosphate isomerase B